MLDPSICTPEEVSGVIDELALILNKNLPDSSEKQQGLRKLMQAKDRFTTVSLN